MPACATVKSEQQLCCSLQNSLSLVSYINKMSALSRPECIETYFLVTLLMKL